MDDLAGVQVATRVHALEQRPLDEHARRGDVLIHPGGVFLTDPVVVRDRAVAVHERLLDGPFDGIVGFHGVVGVVGDGEGEVLAGTRVVGVRQVTEHRSPDPPCLDGLQGGGDGFGVDLNHLGRKKTHRKAMLSNMAASLILHKRIFTTVAKAKALRVYVEPLLTRAKDDSTHSRRIVFAELQNKYALKELFGPVAAKIADRPGGYTRILKTGYRLGDNAAVCFIELVDYNEGMLKDKADKKAAPKTRRSRRSTKPAAEAAAPAAESAE